MSGDLESDCGTRYNTQRADLRDYLSHFLLKDVPVTAIPELTGSCDSVLFEIAIMFADTCSENQQSIQVLSKCLRKFDQRRVELNVRL